MVIKKENPSSREAQRDKKTQSKFSRIIKKIARNSIHLSVIFIVLAVMLCDFYWGKQIDSIAWAGSSPANEIDTKKADLVLSYISQLVPPLNNASNGGVYLVEGSSFFDKPSLSNTIISGLPRDKITTYTVSDGETYWTIAYKFELDIDTLLWANNISDVNKVEVGKELIILPSQGLLHVAQAGDTLGGIAVKYGVSEDLIKAKNHFKNITLAAGDQVFVPGAKKFIPAPPSAKPNYAGDRSYYVGTVAQGTGSFNWPINSGGRYITQYFGWVTAYYKHTGVDLDWRNGTDIIAADGGTVVAASYGWGGGYGNHIIIDHGNGYQTLYGHLSVIAVNQGQNISRGEHIGTMGTTGISTGVHLHFEVRQGGVALNPLLFIK
ncbi:MAG TPA: M23 family metallopeptidase [Patescibacteria group bacterium]|nr:M23 family metallopeptidase [Patescibacteria group bacterium]